MKGSKILLTVTLLAFGLLLSGCGNKTTLTCGLTQQGVGVEMKLGYDSDKIESFLVEYSMDLSEYTDTQINLLKDQDFCSRIASSFGSYGMAFTGCKQEVKNKELRIYTDVDLKKLDSDALDEVKTVEAARLSLETSGYICKTN